MLSKRDDRMMDGCGSKQFAGEKSNTCQQLWHASNCMVNVQVEMATKVVVRAGCLCSIQTNRADTMVDTEVEEDLMQGSRQHY